LTTRELETLTKRFTQKLAPVLGVHQDITNARVAIQGFGNVGSHTARRLSELGARVVAVSDVNGGVFCDSGIDIGDAITHVRRSNMLKGLPHTEVISNDELLALSVDILIPAALEGAINCTNVDDVRARILVEAANIPVTHMADEALRDAGVTIVPDLLANAGGVVASYFEWVQNIQQFPWAREQVIARLDERMQRAYDVVCETAAEQQSDLRTAAYRHAAQRTLNAMELRGF
jgi:glutamate dehydrogenase (NAD(P)+)